MPAFIIIKTILSFQENCNNLSDNNIQYSVILSQRIIFTLKDLRCLRNFANLPFNFSFSKIKFVVFPQSKLNLYTVEDYKVSKGRFGNRRIILIQKKI